MQVLSIRKWETGLPGIQKRLKYLSSKVLLQSSLANAPAMLPKSQKVKARTRRMKSLPLCKIRSETI